METFEPSSSICIATECRIMHVHKQFRFLEGYFDVNINKDTNLRIIKVTEEKSKYYNLIEGFS